MSSCSSVMVPRSRIEMSCSRSIFSASSSMLVTDGAAFAAVGFRFFFGEGMGAPPPTVAVEIAAERAAGLFGTNFQDGLLATGLAGAMLAPRGLSSRLLDVMAAAAQCFGKGGATGAEEGIMITLDFPLPVTQGSGGVDRCVLPDGPATGCSSRYSGFECSDVIEPAISRQKKKRRQRGCDIVIRQGLARERERRGREKTQTEDAITMVWVQSIFAKNEITVGDWDKVTRNREAFTGSHTQGAKSLSLDCNRGTQPNGAS